VESSASSVSVAGGFVAELHGAVDATGLGDGRLLPAAGAEPLGFHAGVAGGAASGVLGVVAGVVFCFAARAAPRVAGRVLAVRDAAFLDAVPFADGRLTVFFGFG